MKKGRVTPHSVRARGPLYGWTALSSCLVAAGCGASTDNGTPGSSTAPGLNTSGAEHVAQTREAVLADCPEDPAQCNISGGNAVSSGSSQTKQILTGAKDLLNLAGDLFAKNPFKAGADEISFIQDIFFASSTPNLEGDIQCLSYEVGCIAQGLDWEIRESTWEADWGHVDQAMKDMPSGFKTEDNDDTESGYATGNAGQPLTFSRLFLSSSTNGDGKWKDIVSDAAPESMGTDDAGKAIAFDWQAGFTRFMSLIPRRLAIIGYLDPDFQADHKRDLELDGTDGYRPMLRNWLNNWTIPGVRTDAKDRIVRYNKPGSRCAWIGQPDSYVYDHTDVAGADVNTGISLEDSYVIPNYDSCITNYPVYQGAVTDYCASRYTVDSSCVANLAGQSTIASMKDSLRRQVLLKLPGFEVNSAIDALYHVTHPRPDLTESLGRISLSANNGLCLDVPNADPTSGTPVQLWYCNGGAAQQWHYDRKAQTIVNTALGKCLQARPDASGFDLSDYYPGNPVEISDCLGDGVNPAPARQKWTYDPEKGIIRNALGTVLDVKWNNQQAGTPVWLWDENDGSAQQWAADGPAPFYDGSTQCSVGGTSMHCCPTGSAMVGVRLDQNVFKCAWLRDPSGDVTLDSSTYRNGVHVCPFGSVMVGYHEGLNELACQQIPGNPITSERVDYGTQDDYPMHVCGTSFLNEAMSGILPDQNQIMCATDPILR